MVVGTERRRRSESLGGGWREEACKTVDNAADSRGESLNAAETSRRTVQCALAFIYRARAAFHGTFKRHA